MIYVVLIAAGLLLLALGFVRGSQGSVAASVRLAPLSDVPRDAIVAVSGTARSLVPVFAPSGRPCAFYEETVERIVPAGPFSMSLLRGPVDPMTGISRRFEWQAVRRIQAGGFFVEGAEGEGGRAFVVPIGGVIDLAGRASGPAALPLIVQPDQERRAERIIADGSSVCVIGRARPLAELLAFLDGLTLEEMPVDLRQALAKRRDAGEDFPCFWSSDSVLQVADRAYEDYAGEGPDAFPWAAPAGAVLIALGVLGLYFRRPG